jgi:multimeric flavodoxin WrbA
MKALAINGSPRKKWSTATLLEHALEGAASAGAETELVHLYDHQYTGCLSCNECKKIGGRSYGRCAARDEISPVIERALEADVLILGSPIYFRAESGMMRSFLERLLFPLLTYTPGFQPIFQGRLAAGLVYAMGLAEENMAAVGLDRHTETTRGFLAHMFGGCEMLLCTDTPQFSDHSKYLCTLYDPEAKARRRAEVFPEDCRKASEMGARLAAQALSA